MSFVVEWFVFGKLLYFLKDVYVLWCLRYVVFFFIEYYEFLVVVLLKIFNIWDDFFFLELEEFDWSVGCIECGIKGVVWWFDGVLRVLELGVIFGEFFEYFLRYLFCLLYVIGLFKLYKVVFFWWYNDVLKVLELG